MDISKIFMNRGIDISINPKYIYIVAGYLGNITTIDWISPKNHWIANIYIYIYIGNIPYLQIYIYTYMYIYIYIYVYIM